MNRKYNLIIIFTFIISLFSLLFLSLFWPKRTLLQDENRMSNPFPSLNWQSIKDGSFSQGFEQYYADQFPFRSAFMGLDKQVKLLLSGNVVKSKDDVQVFYNKKGDLGRGENLQDFDALKNGTDGSTASSNLPSNLSNPSEISTEQRASVMTDENTNARSDENLNEASDDNKSINSEVQTNTDSLASPNSNDTKSNNASSIAADLPRVAEDEVENVGSVIMVADRAMEIYYHNEDGILAYVNRLNDLANELTSSQLYSLPAPTAVEFYASASYSEGANSQKASMDLIRDNLDNNVKYVDAYDEISQAASDSNNFLYLRTDHHWTQLGAYYAYRAFCKAAGLTPVELVDMDHGYIEGDSYGTMLGYTNNAAALVNNPDKVEYWRPKHEVSGIAVDDNTINEENGYDINLIEENVWVDNKYIAFTAGDHGYLHYKSDVNNGKSVLLIKESYGNAFAPFLVSHYENVYILDPRRVDNVRLSDFCTEKNINDVIVLNYSFAFTNPTWQSAFENMIY